MKLMTLSPEFKAKFPLRIALSLTLGRLFISPIFLYIYLKYESLGISLVQLPFILIGLLAVSEISDFLDGYIARRWDQVTVLGKILDPMADSIARISVFLAFTHGVVKLPLMLVLVFLYRDLGISMLRILCALQGVALAARVAGKIKAIVQAVASFAILALVSAFSYGAISLSTLRGVSFYIVLAAAIYTLVSGVEYIMANRKYISLAWSKGKS